jgi:hypothetical protein
MVLCERKKLVLSVGSSWSMKCILIKFVNTFGEIKKVVLQAGDLESPYRPRFPCPKLPSSWSLSLLMTHLLCCLLCYISVCYFIPHLILWPAFSAHNLFNSAQEISYISSSCVGSSKVPTARLTWGTDALVFRRSRVWSLGGKSNFFDSWNKSSHWSKNNNVVYSEKMTPSRLVHVSWQGTLIFPVLC